MSFTIKIILFMSLKKNTYRRFFLWVLCNALFFPCLQAQHSVSTDIDASNNAAEIIEFTGFYSKIKQKVTLSWQTKGETGGKQFLVERHRTAEDYWDMLGFLPTRGTASLYNFIDVSPLPRTEYRLRTIDAVGKSTLSKAITVSNDDVGKLTLYPKIVKDSIINLIGVEIIDNVKDVSVEQQKEATFKVFNFMGQEVIYGKNKEQLDISFLPIGIYMVKIGKKEAKFLRQ